MAGLFGGNGGTVFGDSGGSVGFGGFLDDLFSNGESGDVAEDFSDPMAPPKTPAAPPAVAPPKVQPTGPATVAPNILASPPTAKDPGGITNPNINALSGSGIPTWAIVLGAVGIVAIGGTAVYAKKHNGKMPWSKKGRR